MPKNRLTYIIFIALSIIAGLLSRHFQFIPLFIGDVLWATMVYFITRFLFITETVRFAIVSILFCFAIEFSQLYQAKWINNIRHTLLGKLFLGQGFLWSDLLCYLAGIGLGMLIDRILRNRVC